MFWARSHRGRLTEFPDVRLEGRDVFLRPPRAEDWPQWSDVREKSRDDLQPYEPLWAEHSLTRESFQRRLRRQSYEWRHDRARAFLIFRNDDGALLGGMNINNICRGAAQFASLGYWLGGDFRGRGYMVSALSATLRHCFIDMKLHRVNASTLPHNERSKNLLLRAGFAEEGFARNYIQINGAWQDHILYGLPVEMWDPSRSGVSKLA